MAEIINMPRLSDTMEEGVVAKWLKKVGDTVKEGDILAEIETDKATMEFESFYSGTLLYIGINAGESAPIDSLLAIIGPAGTDVNTILPVLKNGASVSASKEENKAEAPKQATAISEPVVTEANGGRVFASPLAKNSTRKRN